MLEDSVPRQMESLKALHCVRGGDGAPSCVTTDNMCFSTNKAADIDHLDAFVFSAWCFFLFCFFSFLCLLRPTPVISRTGTFQHQDHILEVWGWGGVGVGVINMVCVFSKCY